MKYSVNSVFHMDAFEGMRQTTLKPSLVVTDPPYGVLPGGKRSSYCDDRFTWDNHEDLEFFTRSWFELTYAMLEENSFFYIFWSQKFIKLGFDIFKPSRVLIWHYKNLVNGGGGIFAYDYEPIFVVKKGQPKLVPGKHSCILEYTKPQSNFKRDKLLHPTQKPLELIKHLISISPGQLVFDPFMGSGTTAVAAKLLGRSYFGFESHKIYHKILEERLKKTI